MSDSQMQQVRDLIRHQGVLRPRDLAARGLPASYLARLAKKGSVESLGRGLYRSLEVEATEQHSLVEACQAVPGAVVCLLSALRFHDLTTQSPAEVWLAIGNKARAARVGWLPLRFVRFSAAALAAGVEAYDIEGVHVLVFDPAKTVVDCFKYRNKIGLDVALEALRAGWRERRFTMDQLWYYAGVCRMTNVMRPYLEGLA